MGKETSRIRILWPKIASDRVGIDALLSITTPTNYLSAGQKITLDLYLPKKPDLFTLPNAAFYLSNTIYKVADNALVGHQVNREGYTMLDNTRYVLFSSNGVKSGDRIVISLMSNPTTGQRVNEKP